MGDRRRAICKGCGGHRRDVGELSWTGLCVDCGETRRRANFDAMQTMNGPFAYHWRVQVARSVGFGPLDDVNAKP